MACHPGDNKARLGKVKKVAVDTICKDRGVRQELDPPLLVHCRNDTRKRKPQGCSISLIIGNIKKGTGVSLKLTHEWQMIGKGVAEKKLCSWGD